MLTTAQIGMALAGFAGLVTLLRQPRHRADSRLNEIRFRSMMELGLTLSVFSLLPFIPAEFRLSESSSWRFARGVYSLSAIFFFSHSVPRNRKMMGRVLIAGGVTAALLGGCVSEGLVLALNALGAFRQFESGVYFAALFFHFLPAAFFFIGVLFGAFPREDPV